MKKLVPIFICVLFLSSCIKKKTAPATESQTAYSATGSITGNVAQWDQYGAQYTSNLNTVTVSINGTNYSTVTDASGNYTLTNVLPGTYNISYAKTGCGTVQQQQITFAGNGTYFLNSRICDRANFVFSSATTTIVSGNLIINANLTPMSQRMGGILLTGTISSNPDITDPTSYTSVQFLQVLPNTSTASASIPIGQTPSGTIVYGRLYPFPYYVDGTSYYSYQYAKTVYVANGTGLPAFSVTMP